VLKSLWNDFNNIHANLDIRMSNNPRYNSWYDVYHSKTNGYALKIYSGMSQERLFGVCADMLNELNDPHVGLYAPNNFDGSFYITTSEYFSLEKVRARLKNYGNSENKNFIYGTFFDNPDIGYIYISSFTSKDTEPKGEEWGRAIDNIIANLADTKALVLDIRNNTGGEIHIKEYIAARFASEHKDYMKARTKTGQGINDFSDPKIYTIKSIYKASGGKYGYTKPTVLLTNKNTVSAAEWFTMALRTQSHVTHIGTTTCGAFSVRITRFMINGWLYSISSERVTDMNGKIYEGKGIPPDIEIQNTSAKDEQLDYAFEYVKKLAGIK
jgi:C-terminal processing protease CtpA/Prc